MFVPALEILVPIAQVLSEGSGETVHPPSLTSAFAARLDIVLKKMSVLKNILGVPFVMQVLKSD